MMKEAQNATHTHIHTKYNKKNKTYNIENQNIFHLKKYINYIKF